MHRIKILVPIIYFFLIAALPITRGEQTDSTSRNFQDKTDELKIVGSNIWVRAEPSVGEVIMKLNDGDVCKILKKGRYEFIRGTGHYWYQIQFNGKTGWVFGSQTDKVSETDVIQSSTKDDLWDSFRAAKISECENFMKQPEVFEGSNCIVDGKNSLISADEIQENQLMVHYETEGFTSYLYQYNEQFQDRILLIDEVVAQEGAAGISNSDNFYVVFNNDKNYLIPDNPFAGKPVNFISKSADEFFLVTFRETRNVIMYYSAEYYVFLINTATNTIQVMKEGLGEVDGGRMMDQESEGFVYEHRAEFLTLPDLAFKLKVYSLERTTDGWKDLGVTRETTYVWNGRNRRFEKSGD